MAEDFRGDDSSDRLKSALVADCAREEETALYTATSFLIWLRWLRVILQGEFRRARLVWSHKPSHAFEAETRPLFKKINDLRHLSLTPPELCYTLARRKIKAGHYNFDSDETQ